LARESTLLFRSSSIRFPEAVISDFSSFPVVPVLPSGQSGCFDVHGVSVPCPGSGQDGERAHLWDIADPRFVPASGDSRTDTLTGLTWTVSAGLSTFPLHWEEALAFVRDLNRQEYGGFSDWRLPNRRELRSLLWLGARDPALPAGHPFEQVFGGYYWTSTTAAISPAYAWWVQMSGGRMFYGKKTEYAMVWPVRGQSTTISRTGQHLCYDAGGRRIPCRGSGQDGERRAGVKWPVPRFVEADAGGIRDRLTGLCWHGNADIGCGPVPWDRALELVADLRQATGRPWRLPDINELDLLTDASRADPALPEGHPFADVRDGYWSATSSGYEPDWAYCLYLVKGAVGVGFKAGPEFHVWPVCRS